MTNWEIFQKIKNHLLKQKRKAIDNGVCQFKSSNGDRCAIGCLVNDEFIDQMTNAKNWSDDPNKSAILHSIDRPNLDNHIIKILDSMQHIHDNCDCWDSRILKLENKLLDSGTIVRENL